MLTHVFVSSDYKYFKVSDADCYRSPCQEIVASTLYVNVQSFPIHFLTPLTGAALALVLSTGNIPFEMSLKPLSETLRIIQNIMLYQDVMKFAGDISNITAYQMLYTFYAETLKEQRIEENMLPTIQQHTNEQNHNEVSSASEEVLTDAEMIELFDLGVSVNENDTEPDYQDIDEFLESLCKNNIHTDLDML